MKLSIITINRNNAAGLRKTIESVVSQTYTDFEYIIIDGASTDDSVNIIKEYAEATLPCGEGLGERLYWVSEPDKGIYNAMNKGILKANGEYCLFLNSGDWLYDNDVLNDVFSISPTEDIVYGNDVFIGANVTILDGVTIGDGAVIGAGAVVSKDIPPYAIAVGCPIRILKYRFEPEQIDKLLKIKWWEFDEDKLKDVERMFFDVDMFMDKYYSK
jgi:acetyltransferase-like isoleucine patch superfamily enzyme